MLAQGIIVVCGVLSVWLSQSIHHNAKRWACIIGMCAQPAWLWETYRAEQWGLMALSGFYALGWARGIWNFWIVPWRAK